MNGGGGWIRTNVGVSQRVYSPSPLATRAPLLVPIQSDRGIGEQIREIRPACQCPYSAKYKFSKYHLREL